MDLIALRLQFLYRRMIARRRKIIARIMQEYKEDMASVIRATWLAYKARKQFLVYLANKDKMEASATRIQVPQPAT